MEGSGVLPKDFLLQFKKIDVSYGILVFFMLVFLLALSRVVDLNSLNPDPDPGF
jgi:hypothetical protein